MKNFDAIIPKPPIIGSKSIESAEDSFILTFGTISNKKEEQYNNFFSTFCEKNQRYRKP